MQIHVNTLIENPNYLEGSCDLVATEKQSRAKEIERLKVASITIFPKNKLYQPVGFLVAIGTAPCPRRRRLNELTINSQWDICSS